MSYILDALRKSEQQRRQGTIPARPPELQLVSEPAAPPAAPRLLWPGVVAVVVFASAWWWYAARPGEQGASAPAARPPAPAIDQPGQPAPRSTPQVAAAPAGPAQGRDRATLPVAKTLAEAPPPAQESPAAPAAKNVSAPVAKTTSLADLPPDVRQAVLATTIAMHSYSENPVERLVVINGRIVHEGDELASGLRLEAVTPDGVVFGFKGYRVQRGVH